MTMDTRCFHLTVIAALTPAMPLQDAFRRATALRVDVVGDVEGRPVPPRPAAIKTVKLSASRSRRQVVALFDPVLGCPGNRNTVVLSTSSVASCYSNVKRRRLYPSSHEEAAKVIVEVAQACGGIDCRSLQ